MTDGWFHHMYIDEEFEGTDAEWQESWAMGYRSTVPIAGFWIGDIRVDEVAWWSGFLIGTATHAPIAYIALDLLTKGWWSARFASASPIIDAVGHGLWRMSPYLGAVSRAIPAVALFTTLAVGVHATTSPGATVSHGPYGSVQVVPRLGIIPGFLGA